MTVSRNQNCSKLACERHGRAVGERDTSMHRLNSSHLAPEIWLHIPSLFYSQREQVIDCILRCLPAVGTPDVVDLAEIQGVRKELPLRTAYVIRYGFISRFISQKSNNRGGIQNYRDVGSSNSDSSCFRLRNSSTDVFTNAYLPRIRSRLPSADDDLGSP